VQQVRQRVAAGGKVLTRLTEVVFAIGVGADDLE